MNLTKYPSIEKLKKLLSQRHNAKNNFHLIVDNDGEVLLIESEVNKLNDLLQLSEIMPKYKCHISGLHGHIYSGIDNINNLKYLNQLYKNLIYCWVNKLAGEIDYDDISGKQNVNQWLEIKTESPIAENVTSIFFENNNVQLQVPIK